jgi:hypothetical protein
MNFYNIQYSPIKNVNNNQRINILKKKIKIYGFRKIIKENYLVFSK